MAFSDGVGEAIAERVFSSIDVAELTNKLAPLLANLSQSYGGIQAFIFALSTLIGVMFTIQGAFSIKEHTKDPRSGHLKAGLYSIIAGVCCMYLPEVYFTGSDTVFGDHGSFDVVASSNALDYAIPNGADSKISAMYRSIYGFIFLVGLSAIVRSAFIFRNSGGGQFRKDGDTAGKGLVFFFSGIVATNLNLFVKTLSDTFLG